jgi:hypothetical protein
MTMEIGQERGSMDEGHEAVDVLEVDRVSPIGQLVSDTRQLPFSVCLR